tara:strand:+ start:28285 stop:28998 length:714 start_codon:yes stop_codon:yes gene_type:complete
MATVSFRISDELKRELDELSAEKGYHLSKLFRKAIEDLRDAMRHGPDGGAFDLSLKDRLMLSNQYRILEKLDPDHAERHATHREILTSALETHYVTLLDGFTNDLNLEVSHEVMDILAMFTRLRLSYDHLGGSSSIQPQDIEFSGFDPQFEGEMLSFAQFYIQKLGRHRWLGEALGNALESAMPMQDIYRRMLVAWRAIGISKVLTVDEIKTIVAARSGHSDGTPVAGVQMNAADHI